eukprot:2095341-Pyramimonas_sp.AAC.1
MDNPHSGGCIIYVKLVFRATLSNIRHRVLAEGRVHSTVLHSRAHAAQVVNIHSGPGASATGSGAACSFASSTVPPAGEGSCQLSGRLIHPSHRLAKHFIEVFPFLTEVEQPQFTRRVEESVE